MENKRRGRPNLYEKCRSVRVLESDVKVLKRILGELGCSNLKEGFHSVLLHYIVASGFVKEVEVNE